ncbi:hypothetical protein F5878DRAFT_646688 [Lentinula raphanica]|uniref:Uncharacterized protein n=1 Tax=Lentinula raphanica TaxID=153919 RepID=A0AA38NXU6_9AGAR|nr:hypothetical protein F5878DRAFT_646688 [Lentinula raphanica]
MLHNNLVYVQRTPEYIAWKAYVQCTSCGVAWKNFQGGVCGPCKVSDRDGQNIQTTIKSATDAARAAHLVAVDQRLNKNKPGKAIHSTAGLDNAKANTATGASDNDQVLIIFQCRLKTNRTKDPINYGTGSWGKSWARSDFMTEVRDNALNTVNVSWEKSEGMSLLSTEIDVRWSGNKVLMPNTMGLTIQDFVKVHTAGNQGYFYDLGKLDKTKI